MRKLGRGLGIVAVVVGLSGCWLQPGNDAGGTNWNAGETTINAGNVHQLVKLWENSNLPSNAAETPPISYGGKIYVVGNQARVAAVDARTGTKLWDESTAESPAGLVFFEDELVIPIGGPAAPPEVLHGGVVRINPSTGAIIDIEGDDGFVATDLAIAQDTPALRTDSYGPPTFPGPADALISWLYEPALYYDTGECGLGSDFAIVGDRVLWSLGCTTGTQALGFSPACPSYPTPEQPGCAPDWATPLPGATTAPVAVGNDAAVYRVDDTILVLDAATGAIRWTSQLTASSFQAPAVADGKIFAASNDGQVAALPAGGCGAPSCAPLWQGALGPGLTPSARPVASSDVLFVPAGNSIVAFALDGCGAATCAPLATLGSVVTIDNLIVDDGRLIVQSGGTLAAFGLPT